MFAAKNFLFRKASAGVITYDNTSGTAVLASAGTAITWSHTVGIAGANLYVDIFADRTETFTSPTCNSVTMTLMDTVTLTGGQAGGTATIRRYKATSVASGSASLSITPGTGSVWCYTSSVSLTGVGSEGTVQSATGALGTGSQSTTCTAGQLILQSFGWTNNGTAMTVNGSTPSGGTNLRATNNTAAGITTSKATASTTFGLSISHLGFWGGIAHALTPA